MGLNSSRSVEIYISNNTQKITLKNPRIYLYSGHSLKFPQPLVFPGSSSSWKFMNNSSFWGCNGVLAFEAESFTLAIYFSNPIDYNRFPMEMGLELSLDRVHRGHLEAAYDRLVTISRASSKGNFMFPFVILKESQKQAQLSTGLVKVTATVSRGQNAVVRVQVEDQSNSGSEDRTETLFQARMSKSENLPVLWELMDSPRTTRIA
ncbi:hypothetical protein HGM15179_020895 [Zosterops borbonicus]|uniref:Uncharacterized protein n=1 Tax=Zosterops borbonicus TaxID=364589 RepID=A0A8K1D734_9PASS|nr:hypothetical protein HGM15179_020895 [Zosterops borbonicus]